MDTNIVVVLAWVAGPGLAVISSFVLDQLEAFDELASNGKLVASITIAGICGVAATALSQTLAADASLVAQWQPYANVLVPLIALAAQQLTHGKRNANVSKRQERRRRRPSDLALDDDFLP